MITLINRQFILNAPLEVAWAHLSAVDNWPSWAKHIKSIEVTPKGELTRDSTGIIRLNNGIRSEFRMTEFNPTKNWKWVGPFLGLTVYYDHQFERVDEGQTRLTWISKLVAVANLVAWPIAWLLTDNWLQNFSYRVAVDWDVFFLSGLAVLLIATLTVSAVAFRATQLNPVESLRSE